jgi:hypothetical protein
VLPEVEEGIGDGRWEPLALGGDLVRLDTMRDVDVGVLAARIGLLLG